MKESVEIIVCMGSSCFSRGNNTNLRVIQEYVQANNLSACVKLSGSRCEGKCLNGPNIVIDGKEFQSVSSDSILEILKRELNPDG